MSLSQRAQASISSRHRSRELASDQRAGAWSRRKVRRLQRDWLRQRWPILVWLSVGVVLACGVIEIIVPSLIRSYMVGALIASAPWWIYCLMITSGGLAGKLAGINAEVSTAAELRRLCRSGWRSVNHVMFEHRDIDHAFLGPAGFFAVETKFRSDWNHPVNDVANLVGTATEAADDLWLRMGLPRTRVRALVVLYGGDIAERRPEPFELDGVTFCTGAGLRDHLRTLTDHDVRETEIDAAYTKLAANVETRDRGEIGSDGHIPRQILDSVDDIVIATVSATAVLLLVSYAMTLFSSVLWAVPTAAVAGIAAVWLRRALPASTRVLRATTAVATVAAFMGVLTLAIWIIDRLGR